MAAPLGDSRPLTSASTHVKLGELIGSAVREATIEALRWQNGLEPSYTRSLFYALHCYGIEKETLWCEIAPQLSERNLELLKANKDAVFHDPQIASSAYALAAVLDRPRYGTLPTNALGAALCAQAATLAAQVSGQPRLWPCFHADLATSAPTNPASVIAKAIALGWSAKWLVEERREASLL